MHTILNPRQNAIKNSLTYFSYNLIFKPHSTEGISIEVEQENKNLNDDYGSLIQCVVTVNFGSLCGANMRTQRSQKYDLAGRSRIQYESDRSGLASLQASGRKQVILEEDDELLRFKSQLYTPQILFYLAHAQSVIIPFNKRYKEVISAAFSRLGILPHWRKGSQYYKAILNSNENQQSKIICLQDIFNIEELGSMNIQQSNGSLRSFKNQSIKIKKENAYRYTFDLFKNKLMPALIQTPQNEIQISYEKAMKIVQKVYKHTSSTFEQMISEFHTRAHSKISLHTQNIQQNSLKQLKQQIRRIITQRKFTKSHMEELDQDCKQLVYESIQDLFISEYQQVVKEPNSIQKSNHEIYQKVMEEMSKHVEINYKCMFLFQILLEHMDQQDKVIQISTIIEENSKKQESNVDLLLTFEKESMDDLLISQSSLSGGDKKPVDKAGSNETAELKLQIEKQKNYIKYLEELLKKNSVSFFSMVNGATDSFILENIEWHRNLQKKNYQYLENKIQELKKQSSSTKKLQPFSKLKENEKKTEDLMTSKKKEDSGTKKLGNGKQGEKSSHSLSLKSITPRNPKNMPESFKAGNTEKSSLNVSSAQWRM